MGSRDFKGGGRYTVHKGLKENEKQEWINWCSSWKGGLERKI